MVRRVGRCSAMGVSGPSWRCWESPDSWGVKNQGWGYGEGGMQLAVCFLKMPPLVFRNPTHTPLIFF